jgi:peptidoglycan hydrolase CwlO-like protein
MFNRTRSDGKILLFLTLAIPVAYFAVFTIPALAQTATTTSTGSSLQDQIDASNEQIANLNQQIAIYQAEIQQAGADKKTLQAAINSLDLQRNKVQTQIYVTQAQINITHLQVQQLGTQIMTTKQTIASQQAALADDLRLLQEADNQQLLLQFLSSDTLDQVWSNANAALEVQEVIQEKMQALQAQENNLADSQAASQQKQATLTSQQQSLASQQQSLIQTQQSKSELLSETNAKESTYEKLLASAEAELANFSKFTENAGGSGILGSQTVCDAWGCYYNQRDAAWGNEPLDNTQFRLASDGCLVTSLAMVLTHYGYRNITPITINSNPANFAPYFPAYLLITIQVNGLTVTRKAATIDATLATGNPVIVGLNAYGGTHYVVLISGSKGNYIMRDPYIPAGNDIVFSDHYSLRSIFAISKVTINS